MKILDATVLIAFLEEMDFPDGLRLLSRRHRLIIPEEVRREIRRPPGVDRLKGLIDGGIVAVSQVDQDSLQRLRSQFIDLGPGECACVLLAQEPGLEADPLVVTDDRTVRKRLPGHRYVWTHQLLGYMVQRGLIEASKNEALMRKLEASTFYSNRK